MIAIFLALACTGTKTPPEAADSPAESPPEPDAVDAVLGGTPHALGAASVDGARMWTLVAAGSDDDVPAEGSAALWLCGDALVEGPVTLTAEHDPMVDEEGQASAKRIGGPCEARAAFSGIAALKAGPITSLPDRALSFEDKAKLELGDTEALLYVERTGGSGYAVKADLPGETWVLVEHEWSDDGVPSLVWAGDLDGDDQLDLILDVTPKYSYSLYRLYLSSAATEGPWGAVADFRHVTD